MKEKLKAKILIVLILLIQCFVLWQWVKCTDFQQVFHYSSFDLQLRLIDSIHNDTGVPLPLVRVFHNKPIGSLFDIFGAYLQFWNPVFLASFLSLASIPGLAAQFYTFFSKKKKRSEVWIIFISLLLVPFFEIFRLGNLPFVVRVIVIAAPFVTWSLLGYWYLLQEKKINSKIIDSIFLLSLWYQWVLPTLILFCVV